MSIERAVQRLMAPLVRRLQNLLVRGTVALSNASRKMQTLQLNLLADEVADDVEHFEPYGFTSRPKPGAEHLTVFIDGDRSHGITIVVADRRFRLLGLAEGEVALHDDQGQKLHLTRNGIVIDGAGKAIKFQNAASIDFDVPIVRHQGTSIGKTHTHGGVQTGTGTTGQVT